MRTLTLKEGGLRDPIGWRGTRDPHRLEKGTILKGGWRIVRSHRLGGGIEGPTSIGEGNDPEEEGWRIVRSHEMGRNWGSHIDWRRE